MGRRGKAAEQAQKPEQVCLQIEDRIRAPTAAQQPREPPFLNSVTPAAAADLSISALSLPPAALALSECRICQEEEDPSLLEAPCDCSGTLKYAHRACVQRWCNEKGDTICEICLQPYKQGYSIPQSQYRAGSIALDLSDTWEMELHDPQIIALATEQRRLLSEADYEEYSAIESRSAACCRFVVLILMALLLLRYATAMAAATEDEDGGLLLLIFFLRLIGFLLPCYIMVRAMNMLQQGQAQQAATATAAEVSTLFRGRHPRGIRVAWVPVDLP